MAILKLPLTTLIILSILTLITMTTAATRNTLNPTWQSLAARIKGEEDGGGNGNGNGGMTECWDALLELKSCTNEIILFFINGEGYLGMECCWAIRTITHHCWPSMLTSLGYTSEEGDVLRHYCGGSSPLPQPSDGGVGVGGTLV